MADEEETKGKTRCASCCSDSEKFCESYSSQGSFLLELWKGMLGFLVIGYINWAINLWVSNNIKQSTFSVGTKRYNKQILFECLERETTDLLGCLE